MGISTVTCRVRDEAGVESERTFAVPNQASDGDVTEEEFRMAVLEIARQGLPAGTTLVADSFVLHEGCSEGGWFARHLGGDSVREMTGVAQFFRTPPPARVITIDTVTITAEASPAAPRGTVIRVEDLPDANPGTVIRVEDLPEVDERGRVIPVVRFDDLPDARPARRPRSTV